jgi:ribose-phosphate pyrophosphokinase
MGLLSHWIKEHVQNPLLIGPDEESSQWVSEVAKIADVPYLVLAKKRTSDQSVEILMQNDIEFKEYTPVLIDDIISTGETMITTIGTLKGKTFKHPVCIGVHGIFANDSYKKLIESGAQAVITTNSIDHESNQIFMNDLLSDEINRFFKDQ